MARFVYVCIEGRTDKQSNDVMRVFGNKSTAEIWASQSEIRWYERHKLEHSLGAD